MCEGGGVSWGSLRGWAIVVVGGEIVDCWSLEGGVVTKIPRTTPNMGGQI